ncbi:uncharacterized protein [Clytia hemisphaerica]
MEVKNRRRVNSNRKITQSGKSSDKKSKKGRAAQTLQRYAKGWIARFFYRQFRHIAKLRKTAGRDLISIYKQHIYDIILRHDNGQSLEKPKVALDLRELCDYYIKLDKYEIAFDELSEEDRTTIKYQEVQLYFEVLGLTPTKAEIRIATDIILREDSPNYLTYGYTKENVIDIALHIFVPRGTHLQNTRKSTWLCPIVGNDDALRFGADKIKQITMDKCMRMTALSIRERQNAYTLGDIEKIEEAEYKAAQWHKAKIEEHRKLYKSNGGSNRKGKSAKGKKKK